MGQQPSLKAIDPEIRSLVHLLNQAPYIQTFTSCSGHPRMTEKEWVDGWITMNPVGNPEKLWDFLYSLRTRLDNTTATKLIQYYSGQQYFYHNKVFELYKKIGAEKLFFSAIPILTINLSFTLCPFCTIHDKALLIWEKILVAVQEFIHNNANRCSPINTREAAAKFLIKQLNSIPHIQGTALLLDRKGRWRVEFEAMGNRDSFGWCWNLVSHVHELLNQEEAFQSHEDGRRQFLAHGHFVLRPVVKNVFIERTREDHLKIWNLIEAAAWELIHGEMFSETNTLEVPTEQITEELKEGIVPVGSAKPVDVASEEVESASRPKVVDYVNSIFVDAVRQGASDIHIEPSARGVMIRYRVDGVLGEAKEPPEDIRSAIIDRIKLIAGMDVAQRHYPQNGAISRSIEYMGNKKIDMRVSCVPSQWDEAITISILSSKFGS